jgi:sulfatase modifying factor 1
MRAQRHLIVIALALAIGVLVAPLEGCTDETVIVVTPQVLLYVDTDAPVALGLEPSIRRPAPLFDRLRIDLFDPGSSNPCDGCTNEFEVDTDRFIARRASVGLVPPVGVAGFRARVRLFKASFATNGQPNPSSTIEVVVALPVVTEGKVIERTVFLATDDVGKPRGTLSEPSEPEVGPPPAKFRVGTWPGATRVFCEGAAPPDSVCVPGGAFWLGDPNAPGFLLATDATSVQIESPDPRLVVVSPFYLQSTEVTVAQYRSSGLSLVGGWTGSRAGTNAGDWCTFTASPGPFEKMPLNCVSAFEARAYCAAKGGELPTEAQFAYAAGGLSGKPFVWGRDQPVCEDAVYGRAGWGVLANLVSPCREPNPPGHFTEPGSGKLDRLDIEGNVIVDLAGNLTEWTSDFWNRLEEPCWQRPGVYKDPRCSSISATDGALLVVRGGNWTGPFNMMQSTKRRGLEPNEKSISAGFRCVWKATAAPITSP